MRSAEVSQRKILEFIKREIDEKGYPPSVREICAGVGLKSTSTVHAHLNHLERQGLIQKIEAYVSGLDIDTQQVFRLHLFGEYSFPEIARLTGREEAAVKSRYYRLLNTLRKEFEHEYSLSKF